MIHLFSLVLAIACTAWEGWVLTLLWAWFVVPVFAIHAITVWQAIGLAALCNLVTHQMPSDIEDEDRWAKAVAYGLIAPLGALLVGFVAK